VVYLYWPETARLSLEEVAKNFGDEVAVRVYDVDEESRMKTDVTLRKSETAVKSGS
jgi:predicted RNA-binding protein with RPS1 domain